MVTVNTEYATDDPENLCGESYFGSRNFWFMVDGDNSFKQLDVVRTDGTYPGIQAFIFSGECGQLECLGSGPFFYAEAGKTYYMNLGGAAFYGELQVTLQCSDGAENDLCQDALPITCGEQVTGTFNIVKPCDYADPCRDFLYYKRVWYQFTGNGSLINLKLTTTGYNSHRVRVAVFTGGCCNPEEIRYSYIGDSDFNGSAHKDVYFLSEEGAQYLIAAEQFFITVEDASFDLTLNCLDLADFHLCENARQLQNEIETDVEVGDYFVGSTYNQLYGLVKWKGSGGVDTLTIYGENSTFPNAVFTLLPDGGCAIRFPISGTIASEILRDDQKVVYVLPTLSGDDYLIRIGRGPNYTSPRDTILAMMKLGAEINSCVIALPDEIQATSTDESISVPFSLNGGDFPFNFYIRGSDEGPTYFNYSILDHNIELYGTWTKGLKLVEFSNETCRGYGTFNLVFTDLPDHICPDSIYCPDQIVHLGVPLNSNKYQAQFDIKSNAQIMQGSQVTYQATQQILLNPGFEVFQGATLQVDLGGCREETSSPSSIGLKD
ncbi:MAG: hypothetical protein IPL46_12105 [Saprospiraceae bacterium]|nr:hypothetical protein [Saprospiraceae bacterium]